MDGKDATVKISTHALTDMTVTAYKTGHDEGYDEGRKSGYTTGYTEGREDGHREGVTQAGEQLATLRAALKQAQMVTALTEAADDGPGVIFEPETIPQLRARLFPGVDVPEAGQFAVVMDAEIRALWAAALLSGQYEKGKTRLHHEDGWCCLGVKCDLYKQAGHDLAVRVEPETGGVRTWFYNGEEAFPPSVVTAWSGSGSSNPVITEHVLLTAYPSRHYNDMPVPGTSASYYGPGATLSALNDSDADIPFRHIAWLILGRPDLIAREQRLAAADQKVADIIREEQSQA